MPITRPGNAVSYEEDFVAWLETRPGVPATVKPVNSVSRTSPRSSKAGLAATVGKFATV